MRDKQMNIAVGKILRPHGVKGYVRVLPTTDWPERFFDLKQVGLAVGDSVERVLTIERVVRRHRFLLIKFAEIRSMNEAETLRGKYLVIDRAACRPLESDSYYIFELVGCTVQTTAGREVGIVEEVWTLPANDVYVVRREGQEVLIPAVAEVIKNVDIEARTIIIEPIEGLLPEL